MNEYKWWESFLEFYNLGDDGQLKIILEQPKI